jgi:CspA family cold shock protein
MSKMSGKIKFFSEKGFGFIIVDDTKEEVFFHVSGLIDQINENDNVSFELVAGKKGQNAVNVEVIE